MPKSARQKARKKERQRTARKLKRTELALLELKKKMPSTGLEAGSADPVVSQDKATTVPVKSVASIDAIDQILDLVPSVHTGAKVKGKDASAEDLFGNESDGSGSKSPSEAVAAVTFAAGTNHSNSEAGPTELGHRVVLRLVSWPEVI